MRRLFAILACVLVLLSVSVVMVSRPAKADTFATITVTATGSYIDVEVDILTWAVNGASVVVVDEMYYSNPLGATTAPSNPVDTDEFIHTFTNNSSVAVDATIKFDDMAGLAGDPWVNSDDGSNGDMIFGSKAQVEGLNWSAAVVCKETAGAGYSTLISDLAPAGDLGFVISFHSPTVYDDSEEKSGDITLTATQHV